MPTLQEENTNPNEEQMMLNWEESMFNMVTSKDNLKLMISIIKEATKCDGWAEDATQALDNATGKVPPYIWSFFDMSGGFNYIGSEPDTKETPWIQKQMTEERLEAALTRLQNFKVVPNPRIAKGKKKVTENLFLSEQDRLNEYYDSINESPSWAVLQLFMHRTIREVGKGEEEGNKYCYWPLSQPWVNHRPIEVGLLDGPGGYISNLSHSTANQWEAQQAFAIPYLVSSVEVEEKKKVEMAFMINSGDSKTNATEYVLEENANRAAGNVHCLGLTRESIGDCYTFLTDGDFDDRAGKTVETKQEDTEQVLVILNAVFQYFEGVYGGLKTWSDWVDLYMTLFSMKVRESEKDLFKSLQDEPEIHPHCFNDLVHKTTLLFQSEHDVRFSFAEAQKRVSSAVCAQENWRPTNEVKYHYFQGNRKTWMVNQADVYGTNFPLTDLDESDTKYVLENTCHKITNTGQSASVVIAIFRHEKALILTRTMISCACEQSKRWAKSNNKTQNRDWHQIVSELCRDSHLRTLLLPAMINFSNYGDKDRNTSATFKSWACSIRKYVLQYLYMNEHDDEIFQNELSFAINAAKRSGYIIDNIESEDDFVNFCLNSQQSGKHKKGKKNTVDKTGPLLKKEIHLDGGLYFDRVPSPKMIMLISTLFSFIASGSKKSVDAISKMATLNGSRVTDPRYKPEIEFLPVEVGFKEMGFFTDAGDKGEFLTYGIFRPVHLLVDAIYTKLFVAQNTNKEKITHYLRNIIAFHVFNIYQTCGLRVQIPVRIDEGNDMFAKLLNEDFLSCSFLKKELPNGEHTSTNVPFILTILVLMLKRGTITVHGKDGDGRFTNYFDARLGTIKVVEEELPSSRFNKTVELQDTFWYMKNVDIGFKFKKGLADDKAKPMDLEELFQRIVFGSNPYVNVKAAKVTTEAMIKAEEEKINDEFKDHFNVLHSVTSWLRKDMIIETLKMKDVVSEKTKEKQETADYTGWLQPAELKMVRHIMKNEELDDEDKRTSLREVLFEMQQSYLAKAINISMHMSLFTPISDEVIDKKYEGESEVPFDNMEEVKDYHFFYLKKQNPKKGEEAVEFPKALKIIHSEVSNMTRNLVDFCNRENCGSTGKTQAEFELLYHPKVEPTQSNLWRRLHHTNNQATGIRAFDYDREATLNAVKETIPRKRKKDKKAPYPNQDLNMELEMKSEGSSTVSGMDSSDENEMKKLKGTPDFRDFQKWNRSRKDSEEVKLDLDKKPAAKAKPPANDKPEEEPKLKELDATAKDHNPVTEKEKYGNEQELEGAPQGDPAPPALDLPTDTNPSKQVTPKDNESGVNPKPPQVKKKDVMITSTEVTNPAGDGLQAADSSKENKSGEATEPPLQEAPNGDKSTENDETTQPDVKKKDDMITSTDKTKPACGGPTAADSSKGDKSGEAKSQPLQEAPNGDKSTENNDTREGSNQGDLKEPPKDDKSAKPPFSPPKKPSSVEFPPPDDATSPKVPPPTEEDSTDKDKGAPGEAKLSGTKDDKSAKPPLPPRKKPASTEDPPQLHVSPSTEPPPPAEGSTDTAKSAHAEAGLPGKEGKASSGDNEGIANIDKETTPGSDENDPKFATPNKKNDNPGHDADMDGSPTSSEDSPANAKANKHQKAVVAKGKAAGKPPIVPKNKRKRPTTTTSGERMSTRLSSSPANSNKKIKKAKTAAEKMMDIGNQCANSDYVTSCEEEDDEEDSDPEIVFGE